LSVVYGREIDGETTTFGTTGYTYNRTFLLYDRKTESMWYPLHDGQINAVSGALKDHSIAFLAKPEIMTLEEWKQLHPDTKVLLPVEEKPPKPTEPTKPVIGQDQPDEVKEPEESI
jgi:hypothetical protein